MKRALTFAATLGAASLVALAALTGDERDNAFGVTAVQLEKINHQPATLTVDGETKSVYSNADLEQFKTYAVTTRTPWRDAPATFEGVLLTDVLKKHGLDDASMIRMVAENDYIVDLPRSVWTDRPALIATRVDGKGLTRKERGPFYLVFPMDADPSTSGDFENYWVWMIAKVSEKPSE